MCQVSPSRQKSRSKFGLDRKWKCIKIFTVHPPCAIRYDRDHQRVFQSMSIYGVHQGHARNCASDPMIKP